MYQHEPVLLQSVLELLQPQSGQNFIDGTLGGGGYSKAILELIKPQGKLLAIDFDQEAIDNFTHPNAIVVRGNFAHLQNIVRNREFHDIQGIVIDIGLSSNQLDNSGRGLTFQKDEPLDMRFDLSSPEPDARFMLNEYSEQQLKTIFREFGEEPLAGKLAKAITRLRGEERFYKTGQLVALIQDVLPKPQKHRWADTARRVFQALRIAVNHELENLESFLPQALDLLNPGGRLAVVSFHSLEDRIVKQFFVASSRGCVCPVDFPQCVCGKNAQAKILTKKPIVASSEELERNPRSKSAKLRAIQKV